MYNNRLGLTFCSTSINNNFLSIMSGHHSGLVDRDKYYKSAVRPIIKNVTKFRVSQLVTPFDRRVTALAWHPSYPHLAAAGSKGGDIILRHIPDGVNPADFLTKWLSGPKLKASLAFVTNAKNRLST